MEFPPYIHDDGRESSFRNAVYIKYTPYNGQYQGLRDREYLLLTGPTQWGPSPLLMTTEKSTVSETQCILNMLHTVDNAQHNNLIAHIPFSFDVTVC
jgi:hypothetical protein